jgi:uncharacterized protein (DUF433 family)
VRRLGLYQRQSAIVEAACGIFGNKGTMDTKQPRIILDPAVLDGKPVVRGTRLAVEHLIGLMAEGWSEAEILADYPGLTHEDLTACLAYARDLLKAERVYPTAA